MSVESDWLRPDIEPSHRFLSLGAGVQSSALLLMSLAGELDQLDAAIFADTHAEPPRVYQWLWTLCGHSDDVPIHITSGGDLRADIVASVEEGTRASNPPFFADGGQLRRKCTRDYKVRPLKRAVRDLVGASRRGAIPAGVHVEQWMGISWDERHRMKRSSDSWITHRFPLLELRMTRQDCLDWMREAGFDEPPKSACSFCPYTSDTRWRSIREDDPLAWEDALTVDTLIRRGLSGSESAYVHRSELPLDQAPLDDPQGDLWSWRDECDGLCGV